MTPHSTDFSQPALATGLPAVLAALADAAGRIGVADNDVARLTLVVEELFVNTVTHGQCNDGSTTIEVGLERGPAGIHLRYSDAAAPFDLAAASSPTAEENSVGGLGVTLIHGLCRALTARHADGRNIYEMLI